MHDLDAWLKKYIFITGMLPSLAQISLSAEGLFVIEDLHNLGRTTTARSWPGTGASGMPGQSSRGDTPKPSGACGSTIC
ncbi:hypothetical protein [Desulfocurvibacter africanus]|uniref:hypothetical protein n=1 Tax=Desulfocurvibacter africanus TaxID=873 RepID=UPI0002E8FECF|nr:hypothetical protein [Desulfocurvibacter africanus]